jgi:phage terminase small subunit
MPKRKSASQPDGTPTPKQTHSSLNARQSRFVDEYLVDLNATQAAIRAGYSTKTAGSQGFDNLKKPEIAAEIEKRRQIVAEKTGLTTERLLQEAMRLAFFDIRKLVDADGKPLPLNRLDDDTAAAIQGLDVATVGNADVGVGEVLKYKIADKNSAIERLFKHMGLFKKDNDQNNPGGAMAEFIATLAARGSRLPINPPKK